MPLTDTIHKGVPYKTEQFTMGRYTILFNSTKYYDEKKIDNPNMVEIIRNPTFN